jgi:hypothetical protein
MHCFLKSYVSTFSRRASSTGRPLGAEAWIKTLEAQTGRSLAPPAMGRPPKPSSRK